MKKKKNVSTWSSSMRETRKGEEQTVLYIAVTRIKSCDLHAGCAKKFNSIYNFTKSKWTGSSIFDANAHPKLSLKMHFCMHVSWRYFFVFIALELLDHWQKHTINAYRIFFPSQSGQKYSINPNLLMKWSFSDLIYWHRIFLFPHQGVRRHIYVSSCWCSLGLSLWLKWADCVGGKKNKSVWHTTNKPAEAASIPGVASGALQHPSALANSF